MDSQYENMKKKQLQVEIVSTKLIKPSSPTPKHLQNYKLSFFDQIAEPEHVPVVLFYSRNKCGNIDDKFDEQIEQSLSKILTHVYPLAGRVTKDQRSIICLDQGVTFIRAKVSCTLDDFINEARKQVDLAMLFQPQCVKDVDGTNFHNTSIVIIQLTTFQCGGVAFGYSGSHSTMDGYTDFTFADNWSKVCRLGIPAEEINFLNFNSGSSTIFPTRDNLSEILKPRINYNLQEDDVKFVSKRFIFDEIALSRIKEKISSLVNCGVLSFKPSRVEVLTGLIWMALIRASEALNGHLRPSLLCLPMNLRGKISLPLEHNSFGNYIIDAPVKFVPGKIKMELHEFITLIRKGMQETSACFAKASSANDIVSAVGDLYNESFLSQEWGNKHKVDQFMFTSLCNFSVHDIDFGRGKPRLIHYGLKNCPMCWLFLTECGTGICAQVDLKETYMHVFQLDHSVKAFAKL